MPSLQAVVCDLTTAAIKVIIFVLGCTTVIEKNIITVRECAIHLWNHRFLQASNHSNKQGITLVKSHKTGDY